MNVTTLRQLIDIPEWMADAACAGMDPDTFFPHDTDGATAAKAICRRCDVQIECLAYALEQDEKLGIWGGMGQRQRERIRRNRKTTQ